MNLAFCPQVELSFTPEAMDAISQQAMERKTGARGLRSIMVSPPETVQIGIQVFKIYHSIIHSLHT